MERQTPPRTILQVVTDTDRRGAQVFACDLGQQLSAMGHVVRTVALAPGARRPALELPTLGSGPRAVRTLLSLRAEMKRSDVTIAHGSSTLIACAIAGAFIRRPWVYRQISDSRFWAPTLSRRVRVAAALRRPTRVVALSSGAALTLHDYLHLPMASIDIIPNGVPSVRYAPATPADRAIARQRFAVPNDAMVALYLGALAPEKGVDLAIEAVGHVDGAHLLIVGDGPQRIELEQLAAQASSDTVTFAGGLEDVRQAYAAADLLMLTTRGGDSMPAVLIEAGLCGLASITCAIGAITDVVHDGVTGIVVPVDDRSAVRGALARLIARPEIAAQMGRAAREFCIQTFGIDVVAAQWLAVLDRVIKHGQKIA